MKTNDFRSLSPRMQKDLRCEAVEAVLKGDTHQNVAELFGVTRQSVGTWVKQYRHHGVQALKSRRRGRRPGTRLQPWQAAQVVKTIINRHPEQLKMPFYLWTRAAVALLIKNRFGIEVSLWTIGRYLTRWGFTPQKLVLNPNSPMLRQWLEEDYPNIKNQAKRQKALIYWGKEIELGSDNTAVRTFGGPGCIPVVTGTDRLCGCNMIAAITNRGQLGFSIFKERFSAEVFLSFLRRLIRQAQRKVFLIVDRHPVHHSIKIKKWLKDNKRYINLFFIPGKLGVASR